MQREAKPAKVKKGSVAVRVGVDDEDGEGVLRRFVIPIWYLNHPLFRRLLDAARDAYGYESSGPLRLPCSVDDFLRLRWLIERYAQCGGGGCSSAGPASHRVHAGHHPFPYAPSSLT